MISARTTESFGIETSLKHIVVFWCCMVLGLVCFIFGGGLGVAICLLVCLGLAYNRALIRKKIREGLGIRGDFVDDFVKHACCPCCAVCQEAREANERGNAVLDYCSGERLGDDFPSESSLESEELNISISKTSKIILMICGMVAMVSVVLLFVVGKATNVVVLLLTFAQPILILYFVYWRRCGGWVSLDMVIKLFAVGFWFTTFQSIILEEIIQFGILLLLGPFLATAAAAQSDDNTSEVMASRPIPWTLLSGSLLTGNNWSHHRWLLEKNGLDSVEEDSEDLTRKSMQQHIGIVIFSLFLMVMLSSLYLIHIESAPPFAIIIGFCGGCVRRRNNQALYREMLQISSSSF
jgi:Cys-rich protein (TIGR01571 family)